MLNKTKNRVNELRRCSDYREWRKFILNRDNFKCVLCSSDKNIEVDHIKPLALFPHLALNKNNGRVLCRECHKKTDTFGSFSKFKNDSPIHPILAGDYIYKINSLPSCIESRRGWKIGLSLSYKPMKKLWIVGYKFAKVNITSEKETLEKAIDDLFDLLRNSAFYKVDVNKI